MPQETNLNVSPYFDDFNEEKNFKKVLFKPGIPVQARELTQLQTILQNQVEKFGQHFFKEGAMVIPGQIGFDNKYFAIELEDTFLGVPISEYLDKLVGKKIRGETSGVEAKVLNYILSTESDRGHNTLYLKYIKSGNDFASNEFNDGENLITNRDIEYGNSRVIANNPFATTIAVNASSTGAAVKIQEGVYFLRGYFITVPTQTLIVDQYDNKPSFRVGLFIEENMVSAFDDSTLFDNAAGFSNFAAPGADRFQLKTTLIRKDLDDLSDANFIELLRIKNGRMQEMVKKTEYNLLSNEFARRTYDESGNYYVKPFRVRVRESLNNRQGNKGIYYENEKTAQGNEPSSDNMVFQLGSGKAYVKGFEIETHGNTFLDIEKPRTERKLLNQAIAFDRLSSVKVNRVYGTPFVGLGEDNNKILSLKSERIGATHGTESGTTIGNARLYDYKLDSGSYENNTSVYELMLWDIDMFTTLGLNATLNAIDGSLIEGQRSGARGYLNNTASGTSISLNSVAGKFIVDEPIKVNGVSSNLTITSNTKHSLNDIRSIFQNHNNQKFNADTVLSKIITLSESGTEFKIASNGVVTTGGNVFKNVKVDDIVSYQAPDDTDPTFNRVSAVDAAGANITLVATAIDLSGICQKDITAISKTGSLRIRRPRLSNVRDSRLVSDMPYVAISSVDLDSSEIEVRKQFALTNLSGSSPDGTASVTLTGTNEFFQTFDEDRYNISYSTGAIQKLKEANLVFSSDRKSVTIRKLSNPNTSNNTFFVATIKKTEIPTQKKTLSRCSKITINRSTLDGSGTAQNTLADGLTTSSIYGTRAQDEEISLNVPDVLRVHAIFESNSVSNPLLPKITLINKSASLTNAIQGELIIGDISGATARVVTKTANNVEIIYTNDTLFSKEERAVFQSSGIVGTVSIIQEGDKKISRSFRLDNGQRPEFYDYGRIVRKEGEQAPSKRITIVFDHYVIDGEVGDFATASSYSPDEYEDDMSQYKGRALSDYIDARPRVIDYATSNSSSPFEYGQRNFAVTGDKPSVVIGDDVITFSYSHYLARIDKIFLSKDGNFEIKKGAPAALNDVVPPVSPHGSFNVATISTLPYARNASRDSIIQAASHKRYTMADIGRLETRLKNVEFYTQLSLLETETSSLNITDASTGLDRFKSGFFVDNFRSHAPQSLLHPNSRCSIDKSVGELRPTHYTHGVDLLLGSESTIGIGQNPDPAADLTQVADLESNDLKRTGDVVTLNYEEEVFIDQQLATRTENVNPFAAITWVGGVELNPNSDVWLDEKKLKSNVIEIDAGYTQALQQLNIDPNTGFGPIQWGAWEETWSSTDVKTKNKGSKTTTETTQDVDDQGNRIVTTTTEVDTITTTFEETTTVKTGFAKSGIQFKVNESIETQSLGEKLISTELIPFMRQRNIEFIATRVQPRTRFYGFFDGESVSKYCTPKLIEIEMKSGVFQVGETVRTINSGKKFTGIGADITFRLAQPDHKFGKYNDPTITYAINPYSDSVGISSSYSATSTILNVDTGSLQQQVLGTFRGFIKKGLRLKGKTSKAEAKITNVRMISDEKGALLGSYFVPNASGKSTPEFACGQNSFRISSSKVDSRAAIDKASAAEAAFFSQGTLNTLQEDILSIRTADIQQVSHSDTKTVKSKNKRTYTESTLGEVRTTVQETWTDPLAESIEITDENGVFVSSCDIYFQTKDDNIPVTCQIRTMQTGLPTTKIVPFGEVTLDPEQVSISEFGTVATRFTFPSPVFLEGGGTEYAITLISMSNSYEVFIARMGDENLEDRDLEESERRIVSQQPFLGSLFKSQNGSTWTANQYEDLKFTLRKCKFVTGPGALKLYNPLTGVGENENPILRPNPITSNSQEIKISFNTNTSSDSRDFPIGSQIKQGTALGNVVALLGPLASITHQTGTGSGLVPASGNQTYTGIGLTTITGDGSGAEASVQISSGSVGTLSVTTAGSGYKTGDVLGATVGDTGVGIRFTVGAVSNVNSLIVNRVQGTFVSGGGNLQHVSASGVGTNFAGINQTMTITNTASNKDGFHIHVNHRNHGMHAVNNKVIISDVAGISTTTTISEEYASTATSAIKIADASSLTSFEGLVVSASNPGYIEVDGEVIEYKGTDTGSTPHELTTITRGIDNTDESTLEVGDIVRKYELAGVSLRRINTTHSMATSSVPPTLDGYDLKLDMSAEKGTNRTGSGSLSALKIAETETSGGDTARATQNVQFEAITSQVEFMTPEDTNITAKIRTVSGTSASGSEASFIDQGFEDISLIGVNYLTTPRIIASRVNEDDKLTALPGSKSFTQQLVFSTKDTNVSPVVDLDRLSIITTTNRIDERVTDYKTDGRVNSRFNDPNAAVYITKNVVLENPATSLQVRLAAYRHSSNDIRVLYKLLRTDSPMSDATFECFPGYRNLTDTTGDGFGDQINNPNRSDGTPDKAVPASRKSNEFRDYQFTANDLEEFHGFQIKIIMSGTRQAYVPRIKDLRAIALA